MKITCGRVFGLPACAARTSASTLSSAAFTGSGRSTMPASPP
jgi:hypothetical protein